MSGRLARLRFRYRPSRLGRTVAYTIVIIGFVTWVIVGTEHRAVPAWTLILATGAYFLVAFLEKFAFEDDAPPGD